MAVPVAGEVDANTSNTPNCVWGPVCVGDK